MDFPELRPLGKGPGDMKGEAHYLNFVLGLLVLDQGSVDLGAGNFEVGGVEAGK
jgi:hypothetical protein